MKAGFIGLGTMGAHMAANLQNGIQKDDHSLAVHDIRRQSAASHIRNGATGVEIKVDSQRLAAALESKAKNG